MKSIDPETAEQARELFNQLQETFSELREIMRQNMERDEFTQFKYRCLGNCEPGLFEDTEWVTRYSSITSLEEYVKRLEENADVESEEEDEEIPE